MVAKARRVVKKSCAGSLWADFRHLPLCAISEDKHAADGDVNDEFLPSCLVIEACSGDATGANKEGPKVTD